MVSFGRYTLIRRLAQGGMADVYLAKLPGAVGIDKTLALKRIRPNLADDPRFLGMFINEARLGVSLAHSNIVSVYDFGRVGVEYYLAMEYVPGRDLGALLRRARELGRALPWGVAAYLGAQVLAGLSYVHRRHGVVHGDITPRNILLSRDGEVKLTDFGIARAEAASGGGFGGSLRGTLAYMAPEQARKEVIDPRADLFSLGLVLFEIVSGAPAYPKDSPDEMLARAQRAELPPLSDEAGPPALVAVIRRALAPVAEARFASADEMRAALEEATYTSRQHAGVGSAAQLASLLAELFAGQPEPGEAVPDSARVAGVEASFSVLGEAISDSLSRSALSALDTASVDLGDAPAPSEPAPSSLPVSEPTPRTAQDSAPLLVEAPSGATPPAAQPGHEEAAPPSARNTPPTLEPFEAKSLPVARGRWAGLGLGALAGLAIAALGWVRDPAGSPPPAPPPLAARPAEVVTPAPAASQAASAPIPLPGPASAPASTPASAPASVPAPASLPASTPVTSAKVGTPKPKPPPAEPGFLTLESTPWANVWIDGKEFGDTPLVSIPLSAGKHTVKLESPHTNATKTLRITIEPGKTERHAVTLE